MKTGHLITTVLSLLSLLSLPLMADNDSRLTDESATEQSQTKQSENDGPKTTRAGDKIYIYTDSSGNTIYSDVPRKGSKEMVIEGGMDYSAAEQARQIGIEETVDYSKMRPKVVPNDTPVISGKTQPTPAQPSQVQPKQTQPMQIQPRQTPDYSKMRPKVVPTTPDYSKMRPKVVPTTPDYSKMRPKVVPLEQYDKFAIVSPFNNAVVRQNNGRIQLAFDIRPKLKPGHQIMIYVDGKHETTGGNSILALENISQGKHKIHAELYDSNGALIQSSNSINIRLP